MRVFSRNSKLPTVSFEKAEGIANRTCTLLVQRFLVFFFQLSCGLGSLSVFHLYRRLKLFRKNLLTYVILFQFFGFMAMIAYGVDAFFKFKAWRAGEVCSLQIFTFLYQLLIT